MNLRRLEFTLTTQCNSQCIHCQAEASPLRKGIMDVKDVHNYLMEATSVSKLDSFMVFGGEPMLYPEQTIAIFEKAKQLKIPKIEMITNGFWGRDKEMAKKWAERLKAAGLNEVNVSVDVFHAQHIAVEYPQNAAMCFLNAGIENVRWNVAVVESIDAENKYDKKTRQILERLKQIGIATNFVKIIPVGRATENLREFFKHESLQGPCASDPILGNPLKNPESVCIEPSGEVDICWHLSIGNAKKTPLTRIINEYDWRKSLVTKILVENGPMGLLKLAVARDFEFKQNYYVNKCHLCMEIRKALHT
ncbi:MAG: radical SAM protein [Candidatus Bathyarchaeia archaeon]